MPGNGNELLASAVAFVQPLRSHYGNKILLILSDNNLPNPFASTHYKCTGPGSWSLEPAMNHLRQAQELEFAAQSMATPGFVKTKDAIQGWPQQEDEPTPEFDGKKANASGRGLRPAAEEDGDQEYGEEPVAVLVPKSGLRRTLANASVRVASCH